MSKLAVNTNITLGEQQIEALDMIKNFILEKKEPACLYYGSAGTGKSILVNFLIDWCEENNITYQLCAPTHKAALVLSRYTDREAITLHRLLALSPKLEIFELDFNNLMFHSKGNSADMPVDGVIICDEASMINDDLYETLLVKCKEFNNQIVFTGDFKQLQPVKQDRLTKIIETQPQYELTKIWRQTDNSGLVPVLQTLREKPIDKFEASIGLGGSLTVTNNVGNFIEEAAKDFKKAFQTSDILKTKILCYTNERVRSYNAVMHKKMFGSEEYYRGEFLIGCENFEFNNFKFYNSMDYIIISEPSPTKLYIPNFGAVPGIQLELYDSLTKSSEYVSIISKDISRDYLDALVRKIEDYRQLAVSWQVTNKQKARYYWKKYFEMQGSFATPVDLYFDGRLIRKKSFDYSYAISTHKSQGSTFDSVYVDIRNINSCKDEAVRRQLQYVALSRSKQDVLIFQ